MTRGEKYEAITAMRSIGQFTSGEYPSYNAFCMALAAGRVAGDYTKRIVITSNIPTREYTFVVAGG